MVDVVVDRSGVYPFPTLKLQLNHLSSGVSTYYEIDIDQLLVVTIFHWLSRPHPRPRPLGA